MLPPNAGRKRERERALSSPRGALKDTPRASLGAEEEEGVALGSPSLPLVPSALVSVQTAGIPSLTRNGSVEERRRHKEPLNRK